MYATAGGWQVSLHFNANTLNCVLLKTLAYEIFPNKLMVDTLLLLTC